MTIWEWFKGRVSKLGGNDAPVMGLAEARARMVKEQLQAPNRGIINPRVLEAMGRVPRHEFVPPKLRAEAYLDCALPISHGQTISQPYIVAFMTQQIDPQPNHRVLEIGTGTGYQTAVLAALVAEVYSIEIVETLAQQTAALLHRLGIHNVHDRVGDGSLGWPEHAPFDAILVTCAALTVPEVLLGQLKEGGRMILPLGRRADQELFLLEKRDGQIRRTPVLPVRFVPMSGLAGQA